MHLGVILPEVFARYALVLRSFGKAYPKAKNLDRRSYSSGAFQSDVALLGCDIQIPPHPQCTTLSISSIKTIG
jgi:hypothetical protein